MALANVIAPPETYEEHAYRSEANSTVTVIRIGEHIRVLNIWNTSLNTVKTLQLEAIDYPKMTVDTPNFFLDDGTEGRLRLNTNGTIDGWSLPNYGVASWSSSNNNGIFTQVFYLH